MLSMFVRKVSCFEFVPKRLRGVLAQYLFFLSLEIKKHSLRSAGKLMTRDESRFCALINGSGRKELAGNCLNRASRRWIERLRRRNKIFIDGRIVIVIDSTLMGRKGKKIENRGKFNHGKGTVRGHKFVNFVLITEGRVIPLSSLPVYSEEYCDEYQLTHRTEAEIAEQWIKDLPKIGLFSKEELATVLFLMDSGYDVKAIQKAILGIDTHFVVALKSTRTVEGKQVSNYFRRHRHIPWESIRLSIGSGGKTHRRDFSIRHTREAHLKGVGEVTVVCSEKRRWSRRTRKFLAASDPSLTARQIVQWYTRRWAIETWHREIKQSFGFGDCRASRFSAIEAHVNFALTAYCLHYDQSEGTLPKKMPAHAFVALTQLKKLNNILGQIGGTARAKNQIYQAFAEIHAL